MKIDIFIVPKVYLTLVTNHGIPRIKVIVISKKECIRKNIYVRDIH